MKTLTEQITQYAAYHRDRRNLVTHLIGIPMIVVAALILLSRPAVDIGGMVVSPALVGGLVAIGYYLLLDARFGLVMALLIGVSIAIGHWTALGTTAGWLGWGIGLFAVGWLIQFIGHAYEGRKPAFLDDVMGLAIGPLFIVVEVAFMLGLRPALREAVEARVGPMHGGRGAVRQRSE